MGMFGSFREGAWYLISKADARWNVRGEALVGGFCMPKEVESALEDLKIKYGEPPDDLEWGYDKY